MHRVLAAAALLAMLPGCGDHDDSTPPPAADASDGGAPDAGPEGAPDAGPDVPPAGATWTQLYAAFFGATTTAGCSQLPGSCHLDIASLGVSTSGFVCGTSSDSCWQGMTTGKFGHAPIVPPGGATDATQTPLWQSLYKTAPAGGMVTNNMPQNLKYMFTPSDLALIRAWVESGAPQN